MYRALFDILIILNNEMKDIMKIVKYLEGLGFLIKCVSKTIQNGIQEQKSRFLGMIATTLDANLLIY